jgi:hypothetical protein
MMAKSFAYALSIAAMLGAAATPALAGPAPLLSIRSSGPLPPATSTFLAGYQITEPGISRASVSFRVPTMNCPTSDTQGTAVGLGNEPTAGDVSLVGVVFLACVSGAPFLQIQATAGGTTNTGVVAAGDRITVVMLQKRNKVTVTVTDLTTATKVAASGPPTPDNTLVFGSFPLFVSDMLPVADFGVLQMANPYLENAHLQDWGPTVLERSDGTNTQISPTAFAASGNFKLKFRHN